LSGSHAQRSAPGPDDEGASPPAPTTSETIEIEVAGDYRVRVDSGFDGRALKRVLDVLSRAEGEQKKSRRSRFLRAFACGPRSSGPTCGGA
jgi:hypothetical protein